MHHSIALLKHGGKAHREGVVPRFPIKKGSNCPGRRCNLNEKHQGTLQQGVGETVTWQRLKVSIHVDSLTSEQSCQRPTREGH